MNRAVFSCRKYANRPFSRWQVWGEIEIEGDNPLKLMKGRVLKRFWRKSKAIAYCALREKEQDDLLNAIEHSFSEIKRRIASE